MRDWPGRRYPPTPYPPRSEATSRYRDGWDEGWDHLAHRGVRRTREYERGLSDGPFRHGYRDGVMARMVYDAKCAEGEREARARARAEERAGWARKAESEGPW